MSAEDLEDLADGQVQGFADGADKRIGLGVVIGGQVLELFVRDTGTAADAAPDVFAVSLDDERAHALFTNPYNARLPW